jgi:hypothetical protein
VGAAFGRDGTQHVINRFVDLTFQGWIHTIFSSIGILVGAEQVLRTRRDRLHRWLGYVYWKLKHCMWTCWSYVGLLSAALTEFIIRTQPLPGRGATIWATILATSFVCGMGAWLIARYRPKPVPERLS